MLSVLIVNWNTKDKLRSCLASIRKFPPDEPFEIIVVDNASSDGSAEMVRSEFPSVSLIASSTNEGYAKGNNRAFGVAKGDWLLTLNADTEFEDDSLQKAIRELAFKTEYGALAIRLVLPDGKTQRSVRGYPTVTNLFGEVTGLAKAFPKSRLASYSLPGFDYSEPGPAPQPMGTFLLFRRAALEAVGDPSAPFDERFPIFFNDVDLLKRLMAAGWPCWYSAAAHALHHHGASTSQVRKSMIWESHKSLVRYLGKHARGLAWLALPFVAIASYAVAFVRAKGYHAGFRP